MRHAVRRLRQSPGFTLVAILTLALGIGASTTIFSVLQAVLLAPLPFRDPDRLVWLRSVHPHEGTTGLAGATFVELAANNRSFAGMTTRTWEEAILTGSGTPQHVSVVRGAANYFDVFGVAPLLGRTWRPEEARTGAPPVALLSQRYWEQQFGGDPQILDRILVLNDVPTRVIGVMPGSFFDPLNRSNEALVFLPLPSDGAYTRDRTGRHWGTIARLRDGVTVAQANAEVAAYAKILERDFGEMYRNWSMEAVDLRQRIVQNVRSGILLAAGAVACVLLVTCVNIAGLTLVRAMARRREFAIRLALGASAREIVRQLLAENLLLAFVAGPLGVAVGWIALQAFLAQLPDGALPRVDGISLNPLVLAVALLVTLGTALATGLAPAFTAARSAAGEALVEGARGSQGPAARRFQNTLVVLEIALALVLLVGAGLLGKSFLAVLARPPGMDASHVLAVTLSLTSRRYDTPEKRVDFLRRAETEASALPGVLSAGATFTPPFRDAWPRRPFLAVGESAVGPATALTCYNDAISANFLATVGIRLLAGRNFLPTDTAGAPRVMLVSQATARRFFGDLDPIGRHLVQPANGGPVDAEIVGVVGDTRRDGLAAEIPLQVYRPLSQYSTTYVTFMVRTSGPPAALGRSLQEAIWRIDPDLAISDVAPLETFVNETIAQPRLHLRLFAFSSALALLLAAIGLYGVVSFSVTQRTREFGIRSALGAAPRRIIAQVLRESAVLVALGLGVGLVGSWLGMQALASMIYEVSAHDPLVFAGVSALLTLAALVACLLPARRAAKVEPMKALRAE